MAGRLSDLARTRTNRRKAQAPPATSGRADVLRRLTSHKRAKVQITVLLEIIDAGLMDNQLAADCLKMVHPARKFEALVDRLGWLVELVSPTQYQSGAVGCSKVQSRPIHVRAFALPEINPQVALRLKRIVKHALARHDPAVADLIRRAVGNDTDVKASLAQADPKLQASLATADN